jgi:hypothetical protein
VEEVEGSRSEEYFRKQLIELDAQYQRDSAPGAEVPTTLGVGMTVEGAYRQSRAATMYLAESVRRRTQDAVSGCVKATKRQIEESWAGAVESLRVVTVTQRFLRELWSADICRYRQDIDESRSEMEQERAGARISGYVDKNTLYEAGQSISTSRQEIAATQDLLSRFAKAKALGCSSPRITRFAECARQRGIPMVEVERILGQWPPDAAKVENIRSRATAEERERISQAPTEVEVCLRTETVPSGRQ